MLSPDCTITPVVIAAVHFGVGVGIGVGVGAGAGVGVVVGLVVELGGATSTTATLLDEAEPEESFPQLASRREALIAPPQRHRLLRGKRTNFCSLEGVIIRATVRQLTMHFEGLHQFCCVAPIFWIIAFGGADPFAFENHLALMAMILKRSPAIAGHRRPSPINAASNAGKAGRGTR